MQKKEGEKYFASQSKDEDYPIVIDEETSKRYFKLEKIFNSFFSNEMLSLAKEKLRAERDSKQIIDSSFTYGEIVRKFLYNNLFLI